MIGFFPKSIKVLPKPGEWMNVFKEALGFILLIFTISMIKTVYELTNISYLIALLNFLIILAVASWLYGRFVTPMHKKKTQYIITFFCLALLVGGTLFYLRTDTTPTAISAEKSDGIWGVFSEEIVRDAQAEGRPVFIDFTATWCKNCQTNKIWVLTTDDIEAAFVSKNVLTLRADYTRADPVIAEWLKRYNKAGVPMYLLFLPDGEVVHFPELLTKQIVFNALDRIK
jgi:thiol:disulfide interchange protein DsbD